MAPPVSAIFQIIMLPRSFTIESRKKLKERKWVSSACHLLISHHIWRLVRLILFDFVFFFDLITKRIFRFAFYLGFVVINLHFFLIFFFSHDLLPSFKA